MNDTTHITLFQHFRDCAGALPGRNIPAWNKSTFWPAVWQREMFTVVFCKQTILFLPKIWFYKFEKQPSNITFLLGNMTLLKTTPSK